MPPALRVETHCCGEFTKSLIFDEIEWNFTKKDGFIRKFYMTSEINCLLVYTLFDEKIDTLY
jgi:hypothetical protein